MRNETDRFQKYQSGRELTGDGFSWDQDHGLQQSSLNIEFCRREALDWYEAFAVVGRNEDSGYLASSTNWWRSYCDHAFQGQLSAILEGFQPVVADES
jgi:hypothetical protein